jgi:hypothetical protein
MLLSLFIVSAFILVVSGVAEEQKQKKIQKQNTFVIKMLQRMK